VHPEAQARQDIDRKLTASGWLVQDRADLNLGAGPGVAVREFQTPVGPADYVLFLDGKVAGIIEAKKAGRRCRPSRRRRWLTRRTSRPS